MKKKSWQLLPLLLDFFINEIINWMLKTPTREEILMNATVFTQNDLLFTIHNPFWVKINCCSKTSKAKNNSLAYLTSNSNYFPRATVSISRWFRKTPYCPNPILCAILKNRFQLCFSIDGRYRMVLLLWTPRRSTMLAKLL